MEQIWWIFRSVDIFMRDSANARIFKFVNRLSITIIVKHGSVYYNGVTDFLEYC